MKHVEQCEADGSLFPRGGYFASVYLRTTKHGMRFWTTLNGFERGGHKAAEGVDPAAQQPTPSGLGCCVFIHARMHAFVCSPLGQLAYRKPELSCTLARLLYYSCDCCRRATPEVVGFWGPHVKHVSAFFGEYAKRWSAVAVSNAMRCNVMRIIILSWSMVWTRSPHRYLVGNDSLLAGMSTHYIVGEPL